MTNKDRIKLTLICGLAVLSLGGWLLHFRSHPPFMDAYNMIPFLSGIASVIIVPLLFWFRPTVVLAYLINGFAVILGTILMAHYSIVNFKGPLSLETLVFYTMFPDIAMLWGKFFMGKALFDLEFLKTDQDLVPKGRYFRYPNTGWWLVHLIAWSLVYALGNILWR